MGSPMLRVALVVMVALSTMLAFAASGSAKPAVLVELRDDCEPESFNAVLGPGNCVREGTVTFEEFIAELLATQSHPAWVFEPGQFAVPETTDLWVQNTGGEAHTFTEVSEFGGGFVEELNLLSGNPIPAPECLPPDVFATLMLAGEIRVFTTGEGASFGVGTHRMQCCIHPWQRTEFEVQPVS